MTLYPQVGGGGMQHSRVTQVIASSSAPAGIALSMPARLRSALLLLLENHDYALDLDSNLWEFAIDLPSLQQSGLITNDYRWLVGRGLVKFALEVTRADENQRSFRPLASLQLARQTCFVLTEAGIALARELKCGLLDRHSTSLPDQPLSSPVFDSATQTQLFPERPTWDRDRQELRVGKLIVKQFKVPAANQETILRVFEEERWPSRIDDPLSPRPDQLPKRRLHDTINSLNRNQKRPLVHFLGDGSGEGVRWEFVNRPTAESV